jgi:23S rRNA pseudouridine2605 synthase
MTRIAKVISDSGICSRRAAEKLIISARVFLNGNLITSPATNVTNDDIIEVDGKKIPRKPHLRVWLYYKPPGLVTTYNDPEGRPTVFANLPNTLPKVVSVGRLDIMSEGLLILTNSGEFARKLELPSNKIKRVYTVQCFGKLEQEKIINVERGITIDGEYFKPESIRLISSKNNNYYFSVVLTEGKNREIRKIFSYLGFQISKLVRIEYGIFKLGTLKPCEVIEVLSIPHDLL